MHVTAMMRMVSPGQVKRAAMALVLSGGLLVVANVGIYDGSVAASDCAGATELPPFAIHYESGEPKNQYPQAVDAEPALTLDYVYLETNLFLPGDVDLDSYQALIGAGSCPVGDGSPDLPGDGDQ